MKRTTCTIHLDDLRHNLNIIKSLTKGAEIIAVIKSDAYGHGAKYLYRTLKDEGINKFAVAILDEGIELRKDGLEDPILVLVDTQDSDLDKLVEYDLTQAVFSLDTATKLNDIAKKLNKVANIHIKLDTGMSRVGFQVYDEYLDKSLKDIIEISKLSNVKITGAFTHFANADDLIDDFASIQFKRFNDAIAKLKELGVEIKNLHVSNSPSILVRPNFQLDLVRPGDILYGLMDEESFMKFGFREIMSWETYIAYVKEIPKGATVGYGRTFKAEKTMRIATIPVGFADGYNRGLTNKGYVMINGKRANILGRVCMDQFMVDVTDIPEAERGMEVKLLDQENITVFKMAELINRDVDEIVLGVSKRVPKVYV